MLITSEHEESCVCTTSPNSQGVLLAHYRKKKGEPALTPDDLQKLIDGPMAAASDEVYAEITKPERTLLLP